MANNFHSCSYYANFYCWSELAALKEKLIKEAKVEIETHQATGEGKTSKSLIAQKCTINKKLSVLSFLLIN